MTDVLMTALVIVAILGVTAVVSTRFGGDLQKLLWFGAVEYLVSGAAQLLYSRVIVEGGDELTYAETGTQLASVLDANFDWGSQELYALFVQQPSAFDAVVLGGGRSNTGSMYALSGLLVYVTRSEYGAHFVLTGLSFFSAVTIFSTLRAFAPEIRESRLFAATALFPSVAFWTSALHKEAVCLVGMGFLFAAWRAGYARQFRALLYAGIGGTLVVLFRAPVLPVIVLGFVVFFVFDRLRRTRGGEGLLVGPLYLALGFAVLSLVLLGVSQLMPSLALDRLTETMAHRQENWSQNTGGSAIETVAVYDAGGGSMGRQLALFPVALFNALFRPMIFDVHNVPSLIGAIEMTTILVMVFRAVRHEGFRGTASRILRSPFLLMCASVTLVGCTFVGLATLNLGSLARYRVPFLPFYGALVVALLPATRRVEEPAPAPASDDDEGDVSPRGRLRRAGRRFGPRRARALARARTT